MKSAVICGHRSSGHEMVRAVCAEAGFTWPDAPEVVAEGENSIGHTYVRCAPYVSGQLQSWLLADPTLILVLVYSPPAWAMLSAGAAQHQDVTSLDDWVECNTELVRLAARYPERCLLLNALVAVHAPQDLVAHVGAALGLSPMLRESTASVDRLAWPALAVTIAQAGMDPYSKAQALYRELESMATLDPEPHALAQAERDAAINEHAALLRRLGDQATRLDATNSAVQRAEQAHTQAIEAATEKLERAHQQLQELQHRHEIDLEALRTSHAVTVAALTQETQKMQLSIDSLTAERAGASAKADHGPDVARLEQEAELLHLQLLQVQEELEYYYLQNETLRGDVARAERSVEAMKTLWEHNPPTDVVIDLRSDIAGNNWYEAETDGRWTGPEGHSTLVLPALRPGQYSVQVDVVDSITPEVLQGMALTLNGRSFQPINEGPALPCFVLGTAAAHASDGPQWTLGLQVPRTVSPTQFGIPDPRSLGIRVRSVALTLLEPTSLGPAAA